ncbi:transposase, partial [Paractinoplanes deccanensis]
ALLSVLLFTAIRYAFADQGFAGRLLDSAARTLSMVIDIVRKPADQRGFEVHPKRWVVERTLAWLTAHRRLARDYERDPEVSEELIRWAAINQMLRRLARGEPAQRQQRRQARTTTLWNTH